MPHPSSTLRPVLKASTKAGALALFLRLAIMISIIFIAWFITFYLGLGSWLILQGMGFFKLKEQPPSAPVSIPYAKLGDPPLR